MTDYDSTPRFIEQPDGVTLLRTNVDYVHPLSEGYWPLLRMRVEWCIEMCDRAGDAAEQRLAA